MSASATPAPARPPALVPFRGDPATELDAWLLTLSPEKRSHAHCQELHFAQKLYERYWLRVSAQQYRYWIRKVEQVLDGTRFLHLGDRPERTIWQIRSGSYTLHVCYDEITRRLVTVYTPPAPPLPEKRRQRLQRRKRLTSVVCDSVAKTRRLAAA